MSECDEVPSEVPPIRHKSRVTSRVSASDDPLQHKDKRKDKAALCTRACERRSVADNLQGVLCICGLVFFFAVIFFLPLPKEVDQPRMYAKSPASPSGSGGARVRILHLSLADSDRRARFVLDEKTGWEIFLAGCRERLQVDNIRRVADSSGGLILAVEDVVHDDHLVIYATELAAGEVANGDGTVPFGTMFALLVLWFGISVPLVFLSAQLLWLYRVSSNGVSSKLPLQKPKQEKRY